MKHTTAGVLCTLGLLLLSGCNRNADTPVAGNTPVAKGTGPVSTAAPSANVTVDVPQTVPNCSDEAHGGGQFKPVTLPTDLGFGWTPVTKPAATQYAVQLGRHQAGSTAPAILAARTVKPTDKLEVMAGERVQGNTYRARVVAYDAKGPICVVAGVNGLSPL